MTESYARTSCRVNYRLHSFNSERGEIFKKIQFNLPELTLTTHCKFKTTPIIKATCNLVNILVTFLGVLKNASSQTACSDRIYDQFIAESCLP